MPLGLANRNETLADTRQKERVLMKGQQEHVIARLDGLPTHAAAVG